jgi:3-oxoacyl-[acyl-carrier protein] reductase
MDLGVRDRGYLIVGGTAGMGLATATVLAAEGARVAVAARDADRARAAGNRIGGQHTTVVVGDVNREGEADRIVAEAVEILGGLAGVAVTTGTGTASHSDLERASDAVWADAVQDILMGTVRTVRAAVPQLVAGGGGTVVTTAAYGMRAYHADSVHATLLTCEVGRSQVEVLASRRADRRTLPASSRTGSVTNSNVRGSL